MTFEEAVSVVIEIEGGHVIDPKDAGGETNFGISKRAYPQLDIANLTRDDAVAIYKRDYWDKLRIGEFPDLIRLACFDCAVNQGGHFAAATIQRIVGVTPDGAIGLVTIANLTPHDPRMLLEEILEKRLAAYSESPGWTRFGAGWCARLLKIALRSL